MHGILNIIDATAATIRMDQVECIITNAISNDLGGFESRRRAADAIQRLAEILADLSRRIDPLESGDYAMALDSSGKKVAIAQVNKNIEH